MSKRLIGVTWLALLAAAGCDGLTTDIQYRPPVNAQLVYVRDVDGLSLTVDPLFQGSRAKSLFGFNPAELGLLAVHVELRNNSPAVSFLVQEKNIEFLTGDGQDEGSRNTGDKYVPETAGNIGGRVAATEPGARVAQVLVAIVFSSGNPPDYSTEVSHNCAREELRDTTLDPGQRARGCVYFQVPKGHIPAKGVFRIKLIDPDTQRATVIAVPVSSN